MLGVEGRDAAGAAGAALLRPTCIRRPAACWQRAQHFCLPLSEQDCRTTHGIRPRVAACRGGTLEGLRARAGVGGGEGGRTRCRKSMAEEAKSACTTCATFGMSSPRAAASVATTTAAAIAATERSAVINLSVHSNQEGFTISKLLQKRTQSG